VSRHLVGVWNPSYAADAMQVHTAMLLDWIRRFHEGKAKDEDVYVWWGRVRSAHRQQLLPHLDKVLALDEELSDESRELQFYLTDYRSLYVAQVGTVTSEDVRRTDASHVPDYYNSLEIAPDCWFALHDIRRLVADDTVSVIRELRQLRNTGSHDQPVSLYGGMVDLPLLVTRPDGRRFFDEAELEAVTEGRAWAEFDAEQGGVGAMERELRENLFGDEAWRALEPSSRVVLASAEKSFRDHREEPGFDFGGVIGLYAKVLETELNVRLRVGLRNASPELRSVNLGDGRSTDLLARRLTLGQLVHVLTDGNQPRAKLLTERLRDGAWLSSTAGLIVRDFVALRNAATHEARVSRHDAIAWRNRLLGIGCDGLLVHLARVEPKGG
jgi:hypothetical protein